MQQADPGYRGDQRFGQAQGPGGGRRDRAQALDEQHVGRRGGDRSQPGSGQQRPPAEQARPGGDEPGRQHQPAGDQRDRHGRGHRGAVLGQPLGRDRVDGIAGRGHDGQDHAGPVDPAGVAGPQQQDASGHGAASTRDPAPAERRPVDDPGGQARGHRGRAEDDRGGQGGSSARHRGEVGRLEHSGRARRGQQRPPVAPGQRPEGRPSPGPAHQGPGQQHQAAGQYPHRADGRGRDRQPGQHLDRTGGPPQGRGREDLECPIASAHG